MMIPPLEFFRRANPDSKGLRGIQGHQTKKTMTSAFSPSVFPLVNFAHHVAKTPRSPFSLAAALLLALLSPSARAVVSSNSVTNSFNWTTASSWSNNTMPGSTSAGVTNNADTAILMTLTNQTITLNNDLNIQSITFASNAVSNTISGTGTLLLTTGGTILNSNTNTNAGAGVTNTIANNIAFVNGAGTYTFNSVNNNNGTALVLNGNITSSNSGTETLVLAGGGSNQKIVLGGNITDTTLNLINIIVGAGGAITPSATSFTNTAAASVSGSYFTGNNLFNSLQVGGWQAASTALYLTGSNTVRTSVNILPVSYTHLTLPTKRIV